MYAMVKLEYPILGLILLVLLGCWSWKDLTFLEVFMMRIVKNQPEKVLQLKSQVLKWIKWWDAAELGVFDPKEFSISFVHDIGYIYDSGLENINWQGNREKNFPKVRIVFHLACRLYFIFI